MLCVVLQQSRNKSSLDFPACRVNLGIGLSRTMFVERRRRPRRNAFKLGSIIINEKLSPLDCLVWNANDHGAMIEVSPDVMLPETFRLIATSLFIDRACRVVWRNGRKVGVEFAL